MLAVNYTTLREKLKDYCDKVVDDAETVIVTRKDERNVVLIGLDEYNELLKAKRNVEYLTKIDRSMQELAEGKLVHKTMEELDEMAR